MRSALFASLLLAACATTPRSIAPVALRPTTRFSVSAPPQPPPRAITATPLAGAGMARPVMVVDAAHPIQFPRSYVVGEQLWTLHSTVAQDSMEVHLTRSDLRSLQPLVRAVLTPLDRNRCVSRRRSALRPRLPLSARARVPQHALTTAFRPAEP